MEGIAINPEFAYVILVAISTFLLNFFQMMMIGRVRRKLNIPFPQMYSEKEDLFNCYQRAHQNTLENLPCFLALLFCGGIGLPKWSTGFGAAWILGRIIYSAGYYTGNPKWRLPGFAITKLASELPLFGCSIYSAGYLASWW